MEPIILEAIRFPSLLKVSSLDVHRNFYLIKLNVTLTQRPQEIVEHFFNLEVYPSVFHEFRTVFFGGIFRK